MYLVLSIFLIFGGLVMALFPEFIYQLSESWKSDAVGTPPGGISTAPGLAG